MRRKAMPRKQMRIAIGALLFEGNSLSPGRATLDDFANKYLCRGQEVLGLAESGVEIAGALTVLREAGCEPVPLLATHGGSGGRVTAETYAALRGGMLDALRLASTVDGVYLALHGAMLVEGIDDPEGDLLRATRDIIGPDVPLVVSCDMHANVTPAMSDLADAIVGYQHYPHDDIFETGTRAAGLLVRAVRRQVRLTMAVRKIAAIWPPFRQGTKEPGVMADFYRQARAWEASGDLLAASYFPAQPWLDVPDVGFSAVCVSDGNLEMAEALADRLVRTAWARRHDFSTPMLSLETALEEGRHVEGGPVVLVELADCVGAGATGDSAQVLAAYLAAGMEESLVVQVVDPQTVAAAEGAGPGGSFAAEIGNRMGSDYGAPVKARAQVVRLVEGRFRYSGGLMSGIEASMGRSAVLAVGGATVLVTSASAYEYADEQFAAAGIDVRSQKFVVVKNPMNFKQAYAYAPRRILLRTAGPATSDLAAVPWHAIRRPCFPMDDSETPVFRESGGSIGKES
jgi:microcystin degradation protein MlrC